MESFFHLLPKPHTYFYVRLIDGAARIFPTSYAATGNQTHVSSVAPLVRDLNPGRFTDWATAAATKKKLNWILFPTKCCIMGEMTGMNFQILKGAKVFIFRNRGGWFRLKISNNLAPIRSRWASRRLQPNWFRPKLFRCLSRYRNETPIRSANNVGNFIWLCHAIFWHKNSLTCHFFTVHESAGVSNIALLVVQYLLKENRKTRPGTFLSDFSIFSATQNKSK